MTAPTPSDGLPVCPPEQPARGKKSEKTAPPLEHLSLGILNSLTAHICVLDAAGKIVAINRAWKQFGLDNGGVAASLNEGVNYFSVCQRAASQDGLQDAARAIQGIRQVLQGQVNIFEMEYDCHSPQEKRWFLMRVTPMQGQGGMAVISHISITEKKLTEEELFALHSINRAIGSSISLEAVTHSILEQVAAVAEPDICLIFLREGDELRLQGVRSHRTEIVLEEDQAHQVGNCLCGLAVSSRESIFSLNIHEDSRCTYPECKKAGFTSFAVFPLTRQGEVIGTIGIASLEPRDFTENRRFLEAVANDVAIVLENSLLFEKATRAALDLERELSVRKELEKQLVQVQKIEALGRLAAGMAHEINNPLAAIVQNNQILKRRLLEDLPANREAAKACGMTFETLGNYLHDRHLDATIRAIEDAGRRVSRIVLDMLSFSRKDSNYKVSIDISEILDKALDLAVNDFDFVIKYDFRKIAIEKDYAENIPRVVCTPSKIQQVFFNILKNAADAMCEKEYGNDQPRVRLRIYAKDNAVRIEIEDNGPGMDEETKKRIFDPFFTTKPVGKGTGLGLSVSYFIIVENQNGQLEVESEQGQGARFIVSLPAGSCEG